MNSSSSDFVEADVYDPDQPLWKNGCQGTSETTLMLSLENNDAPLWNVDSSTHSSVQDQIDHSSRSELRSKTINNAGTTNLLSDEMKVLYRPCSCQQIGLQAQRASHNVACMLADEKATLWLACFPTSHNVACMQACHMACRQAGDLLTRIYHVLTDFMNNGVYKKTPRVDVIQALDSHPLCSESAGKIHFLCGTEAHTSSVRPKNICRLLNRQPQLPHRALTEKHPDASSADGEDDPLHFSVTLQQSLCCLCPLVHKQGVALGRSVDLTKFDGYDQLIEELDQLFEFKGELMAPNKNWMIVFTDNEDDMILVGDDPWHGYVNNWCCIIFCKEFCAMVRQIFIYTKEEVQKMDSSTLNPKNEDCPDMKENLKPNLGQEKDPMTGIMDLMKPFIEKVLQQPFFTTDLLYKLVKECVAMLDHLFPSNNLSISAECDGQNGVPKPAQSGGRVPELEEIKYMQSLYMKSTIAALRSLKQIRSKSSTVKTD
ncbi:hypothetical protein ZIOFF_026860 [Zingiber officinale]|uniref:PB1 domain-containing protein n=1 Tax=Zingiber officinale TaxID=94328 RepID=A0A8J5H6A5_ZINOF|nr:hypothetical protein ZIOFF_026860 [Zingiber officinale]